jgi:hypothetical protein
MTPPVAAVVVLVSIALAICPDAPAGLPARAVDLDVHFRLTDLDYKAIANEPVRVVFGSDADWPAPTSGHQFVTDADGASRFIAHVGLDKQPRKVPTNFADSLVSGTQQTDHLLVAAELRYMTYRWLYAVDVCRFPNGGDVLLDRFAVYTPDASGRFVDQAEEMNGGWRMKPLNGMMLTMPGHEPWDFALQPDDSDTSGGHWTLKIAFKRSPAPVMRQGADAAAEAAAYVRN